MIIPFCPDIDKQKHTPVWEIFEEVAVMVKSDSVRRSNSAVEAMQMMQKEMGDVRDTQGMETEENVMRTVKEIREVYAGLRQQ